MASLGHPCKFQRVSHLGSVTARHSSSGRQPNFAALSRGCRSQMCYAQLAGNAGPKKSSKSHHQGTIAQRSRPISSQLEHISTIGKKLIIQQCLPTGLHNMMNFGPLTAEVCWRLWGTPENFSGFRVLAAFLHGTLVVGVS